MVRPFHATDQLPGAPAAIQLRVFQFCGDIHPVTRRPGHHAAQHQVIREGFIPVETGVLQVTAVLPVTHGQARAQFVAQRPGHDAFNQVPVVLRLVAAAYVALKLLAGPGRHHTDDAAGGIFPEQYRLRALNHLNALDIEHGRGKLGRPAPIDAVREQYHLRFKPAVAAAGAQAAHRHNGRERRFRILHVRRPLGDVGHLEYVVVADEIPAECLDRDRHVGERLFALLRGNNDFLNGRGKSGMGYKHKEACLTKTGAELPGG